MKSGQASATATPLPRGLGFQQPIRERMPEPMSTHEKLLYIAGLIVLAAILLLAFRAYLNPAMLLEFSSLQLCS